jgi:putative hemin transport protein
MVEPVAVSPLARRYDEYRRQNPDVRIRDAATNLGVSEAQLVACRCGENSTRLRPEFPALLDALPALGRVMALTRNEHAVIEKHGSYGGISIRGPMGLVLGGAIDLRLFMNRWHHAFAVSEPGRDGERRSLQVFDKDGLAVHKIYCVAETDGDAYDALVSRFRADDQGPELSVTPNAAPAAEKPDAQIDVPGLRAAWAGLQDTHDFFRLLGQFGVTRTQALRLAAPEMAVKLPNETHRTVLASASKSGLPIMVFVGSPGCIEIHTGPVHKVVPANGWFNVLDPDFNLHLRESGIASTWLVRKPTTDGIVTAVETYDSNGEGIAQFFGARKPGKPELPEWRALADSLAPAAHV